MTARDEVKAALDDAATRLGAYAAPQTAASEPVNATGQDAIQHTAHGGSLVDHAPAPAARPTAVRTLMLVREAYLELAALCPNPGDEQPDFKTCLGRQNSADEKCLSMAYLILRAILAPTTAVPQATPTPSPKGKPAEAAASEAPTPRTDALCRRLQGDPPVSFTESAAEELAEHARQLERKLSVWKWVEHSARTNADHAVIYKDGKLWHDPHPEGGAITSVDDIDFLYPLNPRAFSAALARGRELQAKHDALFERLAPHINYVEGTPVGYADDEIDRLQERERLANNAADGLRAMLADANERARLLHMECLGKVLRDVGFADRDIAEIRSRLTKALAQITSSAREEHGKA